MDRLAHQNEMFAVAKDRPYYGIFWDCGLGKTKIAIDLSEYHFEAKRITAVMVVCLKGIMGNWRDEELPKHSSVGYITHLWQLGKDKNKNLGTSDKLFYFIINPDGITTLDFPRYFKEFIKAHPNFALVVDESTAFAGMTAQRTKRMIKISAYARYKYIMSGTPVPKSPMNLYPQCEILSPTALPFKNFYAFRARYAVTEKMFFGSRSFEKVTGYRNLDELHATLRGFSSILKKEDCLDLPEKMFRTVDVPLTKAQQTAYDELREQAITYIDGHEITSVNAIGILNKLLQVCSGQVKLPSGEYAQLDTDRLDILEDLVSESQKTIIWTAFVGSARDIKARLNDSAIILPSGLSVNEKQSLLTQFRKDDNVTALIANPSSSGHGITLIECANNIYYSRSYNWEHYKQSQDRTHRIGQTSSVQYTNLLAKGTVEEDVVKVLDMNEALSDTILTGKDFLKELLTRHGS